MRCGEGYTGSLKFCLEDGWHHAVLLICLVQSERLQGLVTDVVRRCLRVLMLKEYLSDIDAGVATMTAESQLTARQIIGRNWPQNAAEAAELGKQFSQAVEAGGLPRLVFLRTDDRNHHIYGLRQ